MTARKSSIKEQVHTIEVERLLKGKFGRSITSSRALGIELDISVKSEAIPELMKYLRDEKPCAFDYLMVLTAADYPDDLVVTYLLYSMKNRTKLSVRTALKKDNAVVGSVSDVWAGADWPEREAAEMFGIIFTGHPDPRKLLLKDDFKEYPLRKEFKLQDVD